MRISSLLLMSLLALAACGKPRYEICRLYGTCDNDKHNPCGVYGTCGGGNDKNFRTCEIYGTCED